MHALLFVFSDWMKDIYKAIFCINTGVQGAGAPEAEAAATGLL